MRWSSTPLLSSFIERCARALRGVSAKPPGATSGARSDTRRLAVTLASLLSGVSGALIAPLLWPNASSVLVLGIACVAAAWPVIVDWLRTPQERRPWPLFSGLLISAPLALFAHTFYHPPLRVLNLSDRTITVILDGKAVFVLPATSLESPRAGAELALPLGSHQLSARDSRGAVLDDRTVRIIAGQTHLYAPFSAQHCFALETTHYGREGNQVTRSELAEGQGFWVLPTSIDLWLAPAPDSSEGSRWSGGTLTALRHRPCSAPTEAVPSP